MSGVAPAIVGDGVLDRAVVVDDVPDRAQAIAQFPVGGSRIDPGHQLVDQVGAQVAGGQGGAAVQVGPNVEVLGAQRKSLGRVPAVVGVPLAGVPGAVAVGIDPLLDAVSPGVVLESDFLLQDVAAVVLGCLG